MEKVRRAARRVAFWFAAARRAEDLAAEIEDHRARRQEALEASGVPPAEAAWRSRHAMGNVTLAREDARDVWVAAALQRIWRDAVYGARALRREPTFAATALFTLTLGIATTTTVFTLVDAELWKPLPFADPDRLVAVRALKPEPSTETELVSGAEFLDWSEQARLADYAAEGDFGRRVLRRGLAESVTVQPVSANYFRVLDHVPRLGRAFDPSTDADARVAILTDRGWRRLFDASPEAVGQTVTLDDVDYTVVGVNAEQLFGFGTDPDFYVALDRRTGTFADRSVRVLNVLGRVHPDATAPQALAELQAILSRLAQQYPQNHAGHRVEVEDLRHAYSGYNWRPLYFFLAAAVTVLILSCLNVANLLLARALRRQREFAIRGALGGGASALARQLTVEGGLLAVPSAAAAVLLSVWALRVFDAQIPDEYLQRGGHFALDGRIALFVIGVAALTTMLLSLAPILFTRRVDLNVMLGHGARTGRTPRQVRARNGLLVAQLTLTLVLVCGAGLFVRSFVQLVDVPIGFDPHGRVSLRVSLSGARYNGDAAYRMFAEQLLERAWAVPGVEAAAIDTSSPLDSGPLVRLVATDAPRPPQGSEPRAVMRSITPDYFRALGMPVLAGRTFTAADGGGAARPVIINQYLAGVLYPGRSAVGRRLELVPGARTPWTRRPGVYDIVGVVPNIKDVGFNEVEFGNIYLPFAVAPSSRIELIAASALPSGPVIDALRRALAEIDPSLPVTRAQTLSARVDTALQADRFNLLIIAAFAAAGIVLAGVGIYGAMACAIQERSREFGIRLALGMSPARLVRLTLWESARFGLLGSVIGLAAVLVIARLIGNALYLVRGEHQGLLYGVTTTDPLALGSAVAGLIAVATLSGLGPARDAARVDPLVTLRTE